MANRRIHVLSNLGIESSLIRDYKTYASNLELDSLSALHSEQLDQERSMEHSAIVRLLVRAAKKLTPKYTESQVLLSKKI